MKKQYIIAIGMLITTQNIMTIDTEKLLNSKENRKLTYSEVEDRVMEEIQSNASHIPKKIVSAHGFFDLKNPKYEKNKVDMLKAMVIHSFFLGKPGSDEYIPSAQFITERVVESPFTPKLEWGYSFMRINRMILLGCKEKLQNGKDCALEVEFMYSNEFFKNSLMHQYMLVGLCEEMQRLFNKVSNSGLSSDEINALDPYVRDVLIGYNNGLCSVELICKQLEKITPKELYDKISCLSKE